MPLIKSKADTNKTLEIYEALRQSYLEAGYSEYSHIQNGIDSNISAVIFGLPFALIFIPIYRLATGIYPIPVLSVFIISSILLFISTPVHEALHGLGWSRFDIGGFKNIYIFLPLGIADAYCHSTEPMNFGRYSAGTMLPFIILSAAPFILSCVISSPLMLYFALFNAFGCGSDISNTVAAYRHRNEVILDYPTDCGFTSYKKL